MAASIIQSGKMEPDLPVVDFARWQVDSTQGELSTIGSQLADACHEVGFAYIINHGISQTLIDEAFGWSQRLFALKMEQKMLAPHPEGPTIHRGYSYPGLEKVSQVISDDLKLGEKLREIRDCKESYEIGSDSNKEQPNVWLPENVLPGYRDFMTNFYQQCNRASLEILKAIGLGLRLKNPDFFLKFHSGVNNQLRLLHYPPIPADELENGTSARMPAHSDWGSITMLFQDDCGGLEVEDQKQPGQFIRARPLENAIVLNVGDLFSRWTNDYLRSTLHRVTLPSTADRFTGEQRMTCARYSIPYFVSPDSHALIECIPECTTETKPPKYEPVMQREYTLMRGKLQYAQKE